MRMGSKKRAAWSKAKSEFLGAATGGDMSDLFAREDERRDALDAERNEAWRYKSCERKNRYDTRAEAEAVMADCENRGRRGLACYKCEYCGGWHLTSHPWKWPRIGAALTQHRPSHVNYGRGGTKTS